MNKLKVSLQFGFFLALIFSVACSKILSDSGSGSSDGSEYFFGSEYGEDYD